MNYYRKSVNNTVDDVKLKMQMGDLTLKITENINKINNVLEVDKSIKKDIVDNSNLINSNKNIVDNKVSKLDQNLILFNTNLTNFIDSTKNTIDNINLSIDKIPNIENNITNNLSKISQNFAISSINSKKIKIIIDLLLIELIILKIIY